MKLKNIILGSICAIAFFLFPGMVFAALDAVTINVNPETPGQNEDVAVSIQSYAVDLNSSMITWYVDNNPVKSGIGEKNITTRTGDLGKTTTIHVVIADMNNIRYDKEFVLRPAEIDLLWEANTYTPPFYKGKALPTYQSVVKVVAILNVGTTSNNQFAYSYTWTTGTRGLGNGYGKNTAILPMKYSGMKVPVSVRVRDTEGTLIGSAKQNILAVDPILAFYEQAPLLGSRFDHTLNGSIQTTGTSFRVRAVPYFFSNDNMANHDLVYSWKKDGVKIIQGSNPNSLILEKSGTEAQSSDIQLLIQNRKRILQAADARLTVSFPLE